MSKKDYFTVSGAVFAVVSMLHLVRIVFGWDVIIGDWVAPYWLSWIGCFGAGALSTWAFWKTTK